MRILASHTSPRARVGVTLGTRGAAVPPNTRSPSAFGRMVSRLQTAEAGSKQDTGTAQARNDLALVTRGSLFTIDCAGKNVGDGSSPRSYVVFVDQVDTCLVYGKAEELPSQRQLSSWKESGHFEFVDLGDIESIESKSNCSFAVNHRSASLVLTAPAPGVCKAWQMSLRRLVELSKTAEESDAPSISFSIA